MIRLKVITAELTKAKELIKELTENGAGQTGDNDCFFCGEWLPDPDDRIHAKDCPYIKALRFLNDEEK